jgi:hypothetical protein
MRFNFTWRDLAVCLIAPWLLMLGSCSDDKRPVKSNPEHWDTTYIRDYNYLGRIFDLAYPGEIGPNDSVQVYVFEFEPRPDNPEAELCYLDAGHAYPDIYDIPDIRMKEVPVDQWELLFGQDTAYCPVALVFYSRPWFAVGVKMQINHHDSDSITDIGYTGPGTDTLRIIQQPAERQSPEHPAWHLAWRNCYQIPINISCEDIELRVFKGVSGTVGTPACLDYQVVDGVAQDPYIMILGLDQYNNVKTDMKIPDRMFDCRIEVFRPDWGMIIFPEREPFNTNRRFEDANGVATHALAVKVPTLYNYMSMVEKIENSLYYLQVRHRTE